MEKAPDSNTPELEIAVAAAPTGLLGDRLAHEAQMVKAALLYADRVRLASIPAALHLYFGHAIRGSVPRRALIVRQAIDVAPPPHATEDALAYVRNLEPLLDEYLALHAKPGLTKNESDRRLLLEMELDSKLGRFSDNFMDELSQTQASELGIAIGEGLLVLDDLGSTAAARTGVPVEDILSIQYRSFIAEVLAPDSTVLPLMDADSSQLARQLAGAEHIAPGKASDAREAALAASLLGRLPNIADVPMEALLDIREKTTDPRIRFRSAVCSAAAGLASQPWDSSFENDVARAYRQHVEPARLEIEAALSDAKVAEVIKRVATAPGVVYGTAMLGVAAVAHIEDMTVRALAGVPVINALVKEFRTIPKSRKTARENGFFMLYETERRLKTKAKKRR